MCSRLGWARSEQPSSLELFILLTTLVPRQLHPHTAVVQGAELGASCGGSRERIINLSANVGLFIHGHISLWGNWPYSCSRSSSFRDLELAGLLPGLFHLLVLHVCQPNSSLGQRVWV